MPNYTETLFTEGGNSSKIVDTINIDGTNYSLGKSIYKHYLFINGMNAVIINRDATPFTKETLRAYTTKHCYDCEVGEPIPVTIYISGYRACAGILAFRPAGDAELWLINDNNGTYANIVEDINFSNLSVTDTVEEL